MGRIGNDRQRAGVVRSRNWVTFPEFLDSVDAAPKAVNVLPYVPVSPLLIWVMGFEAAKAGRMPTPEQHAEMKRLLGEAMDAGACGWSAQRMKPTGPAAPRCRPT